MVDSNFVPDTPIYHEIPQHLDKCSCDLLLVNTLYIDTNFIKITLFQFKIFFFVAIHGVFILIKVVIILMR